MRKLQKSQAEHTVSLLGQALGEIKGALEQKKLGLVLELLEQCQNAAIEVGTMIEASEDEGVAAVCMLEAYCEQLYQVYEGVRQGEPGACGRL